MNKCMNGSIFTNSMKLEYREHRIIKAGIFDIPRVAG